MEGIVELLEVLMPFVQDLARTFEEAAPAVWGMVRLKVISDGLSHLVWAIVCIVLSAVFHRAAIKMEEGSDGEFACKLFGYGLVVAMAIFTTCAIPRFVATDYYVLLELVKLVRGGQ